MNITGVSALSCALSVALCFAGIPAAWAQDKDAFRAQASTAAARLRAVGEPRDRCSAGAFFVDGPIVSRVFTTGKLAPGDKVLTVNHVDVAGKGSEDLVAILRNAEATATLPFTVEREGARFELQIACESARPSMTALLTGLDFASNGKFDDCMTSFGSREDLGTYGAMLRAQCAALSKNAKRYDLGQLVFEAMRLLVEDATWAPTLRPDALTRIRAAEGTVSQGGRADRFQELVALTHKWPGGERAFVQSEPDWGRFRANAEAALLARLIDPDSAKIEWPYGFLYGTWKPLLSKRIEGYWSCGLVNARNRMGGYTGATYFVVVLDRAGAVLFVDMGSQQDYDILSAQCGKSVKMLPPAPAQLVAPIGVSTAPKAASIADELKKLVELRDSGALSDTEFQAAKAKLLGTP